jgi:hypothetical protein
MFQSEFNIPTARLLLKHAHDWIIILNRIHLPISVLLSPVAGLGASVEMGQFTEIVYSSTQICCVNAAIVFSWTV